MFTKTNYITSNNICEMLTDSIALLQHYIVFLNVIIFKIITQ